MLALNAAIIAAQAAVHGRSFAVVADEVRALAQEAALSTDRINHVIEEMQKYTRETVEHFNLMTRLFKQGMEQGVEMANVPTHLLGSSNQAMDMDMTYADRLRKFQSRSLA